jgi:RecJ-like exonuclease
MSEIICPQCHGRGGDIEIECWDCGGSGYDPEEDKPFAQCHTCYGEGMAEVDVCPNCGGEGRLEVEQQPFLQGSGTFQDRLYDFDSESGLFLPENREIINEVNIGIANLILNAERNPELLNQIEPREFEEFVADLFKQQGFKVEVTQKTRDGGKDIIAIRSDLNINVKYIIECKKYSQTNKVGVELVRQLYGVQQAESANKSVLVTTSSFTKGAIDFANQQTTKWQMDLKPFSDLLQWVKKVYGQQPLF